MLTKSLIRPAARGARRRLAVQSYTVSGILSRVLGVVVNTFSFSPFVSETVLPAICFSCLDPKNVFVNRMPAAVLGMFINPYPWLPHGENHPVWPSAAADVILAGA